MKQYFFLFLFLLSININAQKSGSSLADSLITELKAEKDDTLIARLYNRIFHTLMPVNMDKAKHFAGMGSYHVDKMKWPKGIAVFQNNLGQWYSESGNFDSSMYYYSAALVIHTKAKDKFNMAVTNNNLGSLVFNLRSNYIIASQYYFKALQLAEDIKDSSLIAACFDNIGNLYNLQKNYSKAMDFSLKALHLREKMGKPDDIAKSLEAVGKVYSQQSNFLKAREYYLQSQSLYENSGNLQGLASVYGSLSLVWPKDYRKTIEYRLKAKEIWDELNPLNSAAITNLGNIGVGYLDIVKYDTLHLVKYGDIIPDNNTELLNKATIALKAAIALANQVGDIDNSSYFTGVLSEVQELQGDYKSAYFNFKIYTEVQDSIFSQEIKNKIATTESQREIDKKDNELKINKLALSRQRTAMWGLISGLGLLVIIGTLLVRQNKVRKKNNEQLQKLNAELDNANKVKTKFFGILSHDLRSPVASLINFLNLQKESPELLSSIQAQKHQHKIAQSAEVLLNNMESILLWSKSQMEKFEPVVVQVNPIATVRQVAQSFTTTTDILITISGDENIQIQTDENYLYTILHNLVSNSVKALKAIPDAQISLHVWKENSTTFISVEDNGKGFPESFLVDWNANKLGLSGRDGLGMHIVKDLASAIQCKIDLINLENGAHCKLSF